MEVPELEGHQDPGRGPAQLLQSLPSASPSAPVAPGWTSGTGCLRGSGHGGLSGQRLGDALDTKTGPCSRVWVVKTQSYPFLLSKQRPFTHPSSEYSPPGPVLKLEVFILSIDLGPESRTKTVSLKTQTVGLPTGNPALAAPDHTHTHTHTHTLTPSLLPGGQFCPFLPQTLPL